MQKGKLIVLNVAEKPSAAKAIVSGLPSKQSKVNQYQSRAQYCPVYEFFYKIRKQNASMIVTSVLGHLKNYEFPNHCKSWQTTPYD
jgi:DNA topoisomerase-3